VSGLVVLMVIALLLAVAAIVWGIVALVRRQRYIGSIRQRGWSFVNSPTFDAVARLSNPPFGLGFVRKPDDQITGLTAAGRPFQVIEYKSTYWSGWVGMVTLSRRLPELWITGGETAPRYGVLAHGVVAPPQLGPGWQIGAMDPAFAQEVLTSQLCVQLGAMAAGQPGVNLGIDGDQVVVLNPPRKEIDQLGQWLEQLGAIAAAIDATPLDHWIQPEPEPRLRFYHHPDWYWIGVDDSLNRAQCPVKVSKCDCEVGSGHNDPLYLGPPLLVLSRNLPWLRSGVVRIAQFLDTDIPILTRQAARRPVADPDDAKRGK